jgi:molecular chaperone Hsp31 and glyoxalase 3
MMKKIIIGFSSLIVLVIVTLYFTTRPQVEDDGSYKPSALALNLTTVSKSDFEDVSYTKYQGVKSKVLVIFTEQKNLLMKNGKMFSTGNNPIESLLPMLHLKNAGFDFEIVTPTGKPVVFEMWGFPQEDEHVNAIYNEYKSNFEHPKRLADFINTSFPDIDSYAAVFVPGGHGAMLGIPEDRNVDSVLRWAHKNDLFTITLCHGQGALLSTTLDDQEFLYDGYRMAVFPDAIDEMTPMIGYLPGYMTSGLSEKLKSLGATIVNTEADNTVCIDRKLITGASPLASNELGKLAANTLLKELVYGLGEAAAGYR